MSAMYEIKEEQYKLYMDHATWWAVYNVVCEIYTFDIGQKEEDYICTHFSTHACVSRGRGGGDREVHLHFVPRYYSIF